MRHGSGHTSNRRMAHPPGLHLVKGEWVSRLDLAQLPHGWAEIEAVREPEPWLGSTPHLYALRRMAVLADPGASRLLLSLTGTAVEKEGQIQASQVDAANRAKTAVSDALTLVVVSAQSYM